MKITLLGSLGNINRHYVPRLIADGHEVTVITSRPEGVAAIEALGARAAVGNNQDVNFLTQTFTGSDRVYLMIAGGKVSENMVESARQMGEIFDKVLRQSGVKNVVNLSSVGADNPEAGMLYSYHFIEEALSAIPEINLAIIRPVGFYTNLFSEIAAIKADGNVYEAVSRDVKRAWVYPTDIADAVYEALTNIPVGKSLKYVMSDWATGNDWISVLSKVGISANYVRIPFETLEENLKKAGFSEENAAAFMQMNRVQQNPDTFYADLEQHKVHQGNVKLADFAKVFAEVYSK